MTDSEINRAVAERLYECAYLPSRHASTPSPVAPPAQTQGGDILTRLDEAWAIVGRLCSEGRCPRMSIPCNPRTDEDQIIINTIRDAKAEIARLRTPATPADADRVSVSRREQLVEQLVGACLSHGNVQNAADRNLYRLASEIAALISPASQPPAGRPTPEEFKAMFDRDMARTFTPPADTPPATVPVPLELAREWQLTRKQLRSGLRGDCLASHLYDTLAAGVKEAERGK